MWELNGELWTKSHGWWRQKVFTKFHQWFMDSPLDSIGLIIPSISSTSWQIVILWVFHLFHVIIHGIYHAYSIRIPFIYHEYSMIIHPSIDTQLFHLLFVVRFSASEPARFSHFRRAEPSVRRWQSLWSFCVLEHGRCRRNWGGNILQQQVRYRL